MGATPEAGVRSGELFAALSLATDLGTGQPREHALRTCLLAVRLGELAGLDDGERADAFYVTYTAVWNYLGRPAAAIPAGFDDDGLPLAVQIVAPANGETTLLSLAAQLEAARPWGERRPPMW